MCVPKVLLPQFFSNLLPNMPLNYTLCYKFQLILLPCTAACISPSIGSKRRNQESEKRAEGYFVVSQLGGEKGKSGCLPLEVTLPSWRVPRGLRTSLQKEATHTLLIGPSRKASSNWVHTHNVYILLVPRPGTVTIAQKQSHLPGDITTVWGRCHHECWASLRALTVHPTQWIKWHLHIIRISWISKQGWAITYGLVKSTMKCYQMLRIDKTFLIQMTYIFILPLNPISHWELSNFLNICLTRN